MGLHFKKQRSRYNCYNMKSPLTAAGLMLCIIMSLLLLRSTFPHRPPRAAASTSNFNPVLRHLGYTSDKVFQALVSSHPDPSDKAVVLEVGVYNLKQTTIAAEAGFKVVALDASPRNFERMQNQFKKLSPTLQSRCMC